MKKPADSFPDKKSKKPVAKQVTFSMLRKTRDYENNRVEAVVEVTGEGERGIVEAINEAKRVCRVALRLEPPAGCPHDCDLVPHVDPRPY